MYVHPLRLLPLLSRARTRMPHASLTIHERFALRDFAVAVADRLGHTARYYDQSQIRCASCGQRAKLDDVEVRIFGAIVRERCSGSPSVIVAKAS